MIELENTFIFNISNFIPSNRNRSAWRTRKKSQIKQVVIHHKAGGLRMGLLSVFDTNDFIIEYRNYYKIPYHIDVPRDPFKWQDKYIIYQCNPFDCITWHCRGENTISIGVGFQGNMNTMDLTSHQKIIMIDLIRYFRSQDIKKIIGHCEAKIPKQQCPGKFTIKFLDHCRSYYEL